MIRQRLARLEREFHARADVRCPVCWGHPICVVDKVAVADPRGPAWVLRPIEQYRSRIADDCRCRRCGAHAVTIGSPRVAEAVRRRPL